MPTSAEVLHHSTMTRVVNEIRNPLSFIKNMFFSQEETVPTRHIEIGTIRRGRHIAPFVKRDGAALMVTGATEGSRLVKPAHIRIKRPMSPSELMNKRRAGSVIHIDKGGLQAAMRRYMARELGFMAIDIGNSEEYLCAQALRGIITYESDDEESFEVDFQRDASLTVTLTGSDLWTDPLSRPSANFLNASELVNDLSEGRITDVILGADARNAFLANAEVEKKLTFQPEHIRFGTIDLSTNFLDSGALFLGSYVHGVRVWSYARKVLLPDGTEYELIRPDYAEFIWRHPSAERVVYYGAIEDMDALGEGNVLEAKRFSKSWTTPDPSARMVLVESNPLPCLRRPDTSVSMKVV